MPQIFRRRTNTIAKIILILALGVPVVLFAVGEFYKWSSYETEVGVAMAQPVPFSHEHHVGGLNIDCRYCHSSVETSHFAGMPSVKTCMTCHSQIWHDAPMLKPVRDSFANNQHLSWNRVYRLPDYVYFDHSIHIHKGIGCVSCHGRMDRMPLTSKARTFYMRDCLSCHENPQPFLRPQSAIFDLTWTSSDDRTGMGEELLFHYHINKDHLMDCNTCHR